MEFDAFLVESGLEKAEASISAVLVEADYTTTAPGDYKIENAAISYRKTPALVRQDP